MARRTKRASYDDNRQLWHQIENEFGLDRYDVIPVVDIVRQAGIDTCAKCNSLLRTAENGYLICNNRNCGMTYCDIIDQGAEWRFYGADDNQSSDPTRCGPPDDGTFGCKLVGTSSIGCSGFRIRKLVEYNNEQTHSQSQNEEFNYITNCCHNANLSKSISDTAVKIYKRILETGENFRTENRAGLRTFSVYQSCKEHKYPITEEAVARMFNFSKKTISNGHKIGRDIYNALEEQMNKYEAPLSLSAYINKFCHMLNFDAEYTKICLFILKKVEKSGIMRDNTDISIVSGIIYFVAIVFNMPIKKTEIYTTCNTSDVTINKCFKKLQQHQDELISQTMLAKYRIV